MTPNKFLAVAAAVLATLSFTQAAVAGPRLDKIMETKVIRVGTPGDYRPFAIKTDGGYSVYHCQRTHVGIIQRQNFQRYYC